MKTLIYASPVSCGRGDGSSTENAVGGIARALQLARSADGTKEIHLLPGEYVLEKTLTLDERDSKMTWIGNGAVISSRISIHDWHDAGEDIVYADLPSDAHFTQFYVNGERRERTRYPENDIRMTRNTPVKNNGWANDVADDAANPLSNRMMYYTPDDIPTSLYRFEDVEFVILQYWMEARLYPEKWNPENGEILFRTGSWRPLTWSYGYYLENVKEGLGVPGRWYHDRAENRIYYHLLSGESADTLRASYPVLQRLLEVAPSSGQTVSDLHFEGITFSGTDGHSAGDGYYSIQAETGAPVAVRCDNLENSSFRSCSFSHLAAWALWLGNGCKNNAIERCEFCHAGAGAIRIGEIARPETKAAQTDHNHLKNNRIADCGEFYLGSAGIWVGQSGYNTIEHNDISGAFQWAVSLGWNWRLFPLNYSCGNRVIKNYVHDLGTGILGTHGALYVLGVSPETVIAENLVENVHASPYWGAGEGIILDNSCSGITVQNNIVTNAHAGGWGCNFDCFGNIIRNNIFAFVTIYQLARYGDAPDREIPPPNGEIFSQNIVIWDKGSLFKEDDWPSYSTFWDYNLYWCMTEDVKFMNRSLEEWQVLGLDVHSLTADPLFADAKNGDFTLPENSPAFAIGFEPFSLSDVGILQADETISQ